MPYKHITDRRAHRRKYYRDHEEQIKQQASEWYAEHKDDEIFKRRKANYIITWRRRKKSGA